MVSVLSWSLLQFCEQMNRALHIFKPLRRVYTFPLNCQRPFVANLRQLIEKTFDTYGALAERLFLTQSGRLPCRRPIAILAMDRKNMFAENVERLDRVARAV